MARTIEEPQSAGSRKPADYAIVIAIVTTLFASVAVFVLR